MRLITRMVLSVLFLIICYGISFGQNAENILNRQQLDSVQKIKMIDSLKITSEAIDQIFRARDSLFQKVVALLASETLNTLDKEKAVADARLKVNEKIKEILGDEKYRKYLKMIKARLVKRGNSSQAPLAGETE